MSGITPILDTLLHQVLGRRDAPRDRPLPDTLIAPARAGLPPQSLHSDSRLDSRPLPTARAAAGVDGKPDGRATASRNATQAQPAPTHAAATRFSVAARTIASILARFPAAPAMLRVSAPLLPPADRANAARLAAALRASFESSGLFYEAHLLRWRNGALPLERLLREPQMSWSGRAQASAREGAASSRLQGSLSGPRLAAPGDAASSATGDSTHAPDGARQTVHPALEGLVRHQLEMLAAPMLHWEGSPWTGASMALVMQPPLHPDPERAGDDDEGQARGSIEAPWQTRLTLRFPRLGEVKVNLQLGAERMALDLEAGADAIVRMDAESGRLHERLVALGFRSVVLRMQAGSQQGADDGR